MQSKIPKYPTLILFLVLLLLLLPGPQRSRGADNKDRILFGVAGSQWKTLSGLSGTCSKLAKLALLEGIYDGLWLGDSPRREAFYTRMSFDDLETAIDQFYEDYRNQKAFVVDAIEIVSMELRGLSKEEIDLKIRASRKMASDLSEGKFRDGK